MTAGPNSPGVGPAAYQPALAKSVGASSLPFLSTFRSTRPLVRTPIDGMTRDTGELGPMMGPKSGPGVEDGAAGLGVEEPVGRLVADRPGVGAASRVAWVPWARSGWGGAPGPVRAFATSTPPTRSSRAV